MATRNHGGQNVIEKAKEYQKRKNLEVPPCFKGNSFALLHPSVLNDMSKKVNISIGNDASDNISVIDELINNELSKNLQFARENPTIVLPDSLDIGKVQLSELSHAYPTVSTSYVSDNQLIDSGLGANITGREKFSELKYTYGIS
jgi:hypothetical protein